MHTYNGPYKCTHNTPQGGIHTYTQQPVKMYTHIYLGTHIHTHKQTIIEISINNTYTCTLTHAHTNKAWSYILDLERNE